MKRFGFFFVAALALGSLALGKGKALTCPEQCAEDTKKCVDICQDKGVAKNLAQCKSMCAEGQKYCENKCKGIK